MAHEFQEPAFYFFPQNQFPESMVPRLIREGGYGVPQFGKIIYRICFVLSQFLCSIVFFRTKIVHRVFFVHLGFAGRYIYIYLYIYIYNETNM